MQINKKLLLATFIISAHGAIISMEPSVAEASDVAKANRIEAKLKTITQ